MRILIVKLSSLGDVIHTLPVLVDIKKNIPNAQIHWVVEPSFASLLERHPLIDKVIVCPLRMWLKNRFDASSRAMAKTFLGVLREDAYDYVLDLQGLTKSALVARCALLSPKGQRVAMANQTEGSSYEAMTRWLSTLAVALPTHIDAVARSRMLCAKAFNYELPSDLEFGLLSSPSASPFEATVQSGVQTCQEGQSPQVLLIHGTSRADKSWPLSHWVTLSNRLIESGNAVCVTYAGEEELAFVQTLRQQVKDITLWPQQSIGDLSQSMRNLTGAIGVDSGLSHLAVALNLAHVQIYNFPTQWRTGPLHRPYQVSVFDTPTPSVEAVWLEWCKVIKIKRTEPC